MSQKGRVDRLEARTGDKSQPFAVDWQRGDGLVTVNGVEMTREEFERRWPHGHICRVVYESLPVVEGELVENE